MSDRLFVQARRLGLLCFVLGMPSCSLWVGKVTTEIHVRGLEKAISPRITINELRWGFPQIRHVPVFEGALPANRTLCLDMVRGRGYSFYFVDPDKRPLAGLLMPLDGYYHHAPKRSVGVDRIVLVPPSPIP